MTDNILDERAQKILNLLVQHYIREGQPVGSTALARENTITISSASVRSIMADLEAAGFLTSPHTSAGRVPTDLGYRFFVDQLLHAYPEQSDDLGALAEQFEPDKDAQSLINSASALLSEFTQLAGVVTLPQREKIVLRQVEFLSLSKHRVLVILVFNDKEVQNRIVYTDRTYSPSELERAGNYLTKQFAGKTLSEVREALLSSLHEDCDDMYDVMQTVLEVGNKAFEIPDEDCAIAGEAHLLDMAQAGDMDRLKALFEAFSQKRDILGLLDKSLKAEGMQIFIGEEAGYDILRDCSIVTAPYGANGQVLGVLGVIGPTRMAYQRAISVVDVTAKLLGAALAT